MKNKTEMLQKIYEQAQETLQSIDKAKEVATKAYKNAYKMYHDALDEL